MLKPFDATMREIYEIEPVAWPDFLALPVPDPSLVDVIESNLSTIAAEADKLLRIGGPSPFILHLEFLSGRNMAYPDQALWYNTLAEPQARVAGLVRGGPAPPGGRRPRADGRLMRRKSPAGAGASGFTTTSSGSGSCRRSAC